MLATPELMLQAVEAQRLYDALPQVLKTVPLYSRYGKGIGESKSLPVTEWFHQLPMLTKRDLYRDFPRNFLAKNTDLRALIDADLVELESTSGTSEERIPLLLPRGWWDEQELRALRLNCVMAKLFAQEPNVRRATMNSPACNSDIFFTGVPARSERIVGHSLFLSLSRYPFLWSETDLDRMAGEAIDWAPHFLDVDPVYGVLFALYCERKRLRLPSLRCIVSSYEFISLAHRRILQRVFDVPVFDLYGSTETGHLLMEDEHGEMHPSLETALFEVINIDKNGVGELVLTSLTNKFMPLVRYHIGDLVERVTHPYGTRYIVHGRISDSFILSRGRRVTTRLVDQCFIGIDGIIHYQLIQRSATQWLLRLVPDRAGPKAEQIRVIKSRLQHLLENKASIEIERTDLFVPEKSGKFRLTFPTLTTEDQARSTG